MDVTAPQGWLVFAHILGAFIFTAGHGVSIAVAFAVRRTTDQARLRALLDLSAGSLNLAGVGFLILLVAGIVAGIGGGWFSRGWIWASLIVFILVTAVMTPLGARWFNDIRRQVGARTGDRTTASASPMPLLPDDLDHVLASRRPEQLAVIGGAGFVVILWLMVFKPF